MKLIREKITVEELKPMADKMFNRLVKAVVDIEQEIMVVDADMHVDEENFLLDEGCEQKNLWGINFYPYGDPANFLEFDSMINIRPADGNRSRSVENPEVRDRIRALVNKLVVR